MRRALVVCVLLLSCSSEQRSSPACSVDGDCGDSLTTPCVRHACRAGVCKTENLTNNTPVPSAFLQMPCSKLVCMDGEIKAIADPTNRPASEECTTYECEGTSMITRDLIGKPCAGGVCAAMNRCEPYDGGTSSDAGDAGCVAIGTHDIPERSIAETICNEEKKAGRPCHVCVQSVDGAGTPRTFSAISTPESCGCPPPTTVVTDAGAD